MSCDFIKDIADKQHIFSAVPSTFSLKTVVKMVNCFLSINCDQTAAGSNSDDCFLLRIEEEIYCGPYWK